MEVELDSATQFKDILDVCSALHSDISMLFGSDGLTIKVMSDDSVAMVNFTAKKEYFRRYEVPSPSKISVFLDDVLKVLKFAKSGDGLILSSDNDKLYITILGKHKLKFTVPLVSGDYTPSTEPKLNFDSFIEINAGLLENAVKAALSIDDTVGFILDKDSFTVYSKGDQKEFEQTFSLSDTPEITNISTKGRIESKYYGELLENLLSALDSDKQLKLYFATDYPLKIEYNINENASIVYLQAQRIA